MDEDSIAKRIKRARKALPGKVSQDELAKRIGVATMTVSRWETGGLKPEKENLQRLADALGVAPRWIDYGDEEPSPSPAAESRVERDADEGHPVVEEFIEDNRGDLSEDEVARLRRNFYRGADEDFVREHLPKYLLSMRRAPKVEDRGEVAKPAVREGARQIGPRSGK